MARYTVTCGSVYGVDMITVEAETAAKAKYKASKQAFSDFGVFVKYFNPEVKKVADDTPISWKRYSDDNPSGEMELLFEVLPDGTIKRGET